MQTAPYSDVYFFIAIHMDEDSLQFTEDRLQNCRWITLSGETATAWSCMSLLEVQSSQGLGLVAKLTKLL